MNEYRTSLFVVALFLPLFVSTVARAQTDAALSLYGTFSRTTNYNSGFEHQNAASAVGGLFEFRHIRSPLVGYEITYSFNRANQVYSYGGLAPVGFAPETFSVSVPADTHEITGDWLFSAQTGKLKPFAVAGIGILITRPVSGHPETTVSDEPVYVYGAGLDWRLVSHFGLRLQYRGNVYKAPNITAAYGSNGGFTHTAEPIIGACFEF
jgi:hypothetical protein